MFFAIVKSEETNVYIDVVFVVFQKYKPFKGVKYITRAGKFQVRT